MPNINMHLSHSLQRAFINSIDATVRSRMTKGTMIIIKAIRFRFVPFSSGPRYQFDFFLSFLAEWVWFLSMLFMLASHREYDSSLHYFLTMGWRLCLDWFIHVFLKITSYVANWCFSIEISFGFSRQHFIETYPKGDTENFQYSTSIFIRRTISVQLNVLKQSTKKFSN